MLNTEEIISNFYSKSSKTYDILISHGMQVANKAIEIVDNILKINYVDIDKDFIIEASILHDIGIFMTDAISIGCNGSLPYLCHGVEGRKILDNIGLYKHGLVCERHIGMGLSCKDIIQMKLPLPIRDMIPISLEEKIVCYSDKFFSKNSIDVQKDIEVVLNDLAKHGRKNVIYFLELHNYFNTSLDFY